MKPYYLLFSLALCSNVVCSKVSAQTKLPYDTIIDGKKCVIASFRGGIDGWRKYLESNLQYPKKAIKKNIQGVVKMQLQLDEKGNITEIYALNDPGGGLAAEAVRVVKEGPKWIPASEDGKPVPYRFVQTITFQLQ